MYLKSQLYLYHFHYTEYYFIVFNLNKNKWCYEHINFLKCAKANFTIPNFIDQIVKKFS